MRSGRVIGATASWTAAATTLVLAYGHSSRYPVRQDLAWACICVGLLAAGAVAAHVAVCAGAPIPLLAAVIVPLPSDDLGGLAALMLGAAFLILSPVPLLIGVLIGRRRRPPWPTLVIVAVALVPVAVARADHDAIVRVQRDRPVSLDGGYGAVRLGMTVAQVERILGPAEHIDLDQGDDSGVAVATGYLRVTDKVLGYGNVEFNLRRGRVELIQVSNQAARLPGGVGVGDSIKLLGPALPPMSCTTEFRGEDNEPYPLCEGRLPNGVNVLAVGDYAIRGAPITVVLLSHRKPWG